jgi:chitin disaccharide deacetylase
VKYLIVNADDFGMTIGINSGVIEAHSRGIVTSASLMVRREHAAGAAKLAAQYPRLGLGLHIDLVEWEPVGGINRENYRRVDLDDAADVTREIEQQLAMFVSLTGRQPDHLDSHQHVHLSGAPKHESMRLARSLKVPLRNLDSAVAFCGGFYGQQGLAKPYAEGISVANFLHLVDLMQDGWTELMCHPGHAHDVQSVYAAEREAELVTLCEPKLRAALRERDIELCSFGGMSRERFSP